MASSNKSTQSIQHFQKGKSQPTTTTQCDACGLQGHIAVECNAWAKFLLVSKFNKNADESKKAKAIANYLERAQTPKQRRHQLKATIRHLVEHNQIDEIIAMIQPDEGSEEETATTSQSKQLIPTGPSEE